MNLVKTPKAYKKLWNEIKQTDPWRYDLNEEFYENMHDNIMASLNKNPDWAQNTSTKWWSSWKDVKSWRPKKGG